MVIKFIRSRAIARVALAIEPDLHQVPLKLLNSAYLYRTQSPMMAKKISLKSVEYRANKYIIYNCPLYF